MWRQELEAERSRNWERSLYKEQGRDTDGEAKIRGMRKFWTSGILNGSGREWSERENWKGAREGKMKRRKEPSSGPSKSSRNTRFISHSDTESSVERRFLVIQLLNRFKFWVILFASFVTSEGRSLFVNSHQIILWNMTKRIIPTITRVKRFPFQAFGLKTQIEDWKWHKHYCGSWQQIEKMISVRTSEAAVEEAERRSTWSFRGKFLSLKFNWISHDIQFLTSNIQLWIDHLWNEAGKSLLSFPKF